MSLPIPHDGTAPRDRDVKPANVPPEAGDPPRTRDGKSDPSPNSGEGQGKATEQTAWQKLSAREKRERALSSMREPDVGCPRCGTRCLPHDLMGHMDLRCAGELPEPHARSRWLRRVEALRLATASRIDTWAERGLLRQRPDGYVLETDLVMLVAWARVLGAL